MGEAVWPFSKIEKLTYLYMKNLSSASLDTLMADQSFGARIKLIRQLVERLKGQEEGKSLALKCINSADQLSKTRNMLVHNPWSIWIDLETAKFRTEIQKNTDENKKLDLAKVREFRDAARELASSFEYALKQLRYPGP